MTFELVLDGFNRVAETLPPTIAGLDAEQLSWRPAPGANPAGWLAWHIARVEDAQMADLSRKLVDRSARAVWEDGWRERFALPYGPDAHGYGMSDDEVDAFSANDAQLLTDYYAAVHEATMDIVRKLRDVPGVVDRVIDTNWEPPVTGGVRLVSVLDDVTQHVGQLAYLRHLIDVR